MYNMLMKNNNYAIRPVLPSLGGQNISLLFRNIDVFSQSIIALSEAINEQSKRIATIFETQVQPVLEACMFAAIIERQRRMIEAMTPRFDFLESYLKTLRVPIFPTGLMNFPNIVEGEVEEDKENNPEKVKQETVSETKSLAMPVPQAIKPYRTIAVREEYLKIGFGITLSIEGRFRHNRRLIRSLNSSSKHGKFFFMLLTSPNNYLADETFKSKVALADQEKGIYYIKSDLVEIFMENGLKLHFYRQRKTGYKLLKITRLPN